MKKTIQIGILLFFFLSAIPVFAQQRFPRPEFETGFETPQATTPPARDFIYQYLDVFMLLILLSLMTWFVLKKRSRIAIFWTSIISLLYFGFWKKGCVCSVGSIQNITLGLFDPAYFISIPVLLIFLLPLVYALFFGRTFCAGVCYMGALQDLVIYKPKKIGPGWQKALGIIPYIYLGFTLIFAATGSDFIICRFDPFIGFFRQSASFNMFILGAAIIITGMFIARPYCRFLCPFGVILGWLSRLSKWHAAVTPSECILCKLCENTCPVDAINYPVSQIHPEKGGIRRLLMLIILIPVFAGLGGFLLSLFYKPVSLVNPTVKLALLIEKDLKAGIKSTSIDAQTFYSSGTTIEELVNQAVEIRQKFYFGLWILGGFLGIMLGIALIRLSIARITRIYEPDRESCISCGRCFDFCPVGKIPEATINNFKFDRLS